MNKNSNLLIVDRNYRRANWAIALSFIAIAFSIPAIFISLPRAHDLSFD